MLLNCKMTFILIWWIGHRRICFRLDYILVCISGVRATVKFVFWLRFFWRCEYTIKLWVGGKQSILVSIKIDETFIIIPSKVVKLCDLATDGDSVTSVQWADKGDLLAVGTNKGITQIWDVHAQKRVCCMPFLLSKCLWFTELFFFFLE